MFQSQNVYWETVLQKVFFFRETVNKKFLKLISGILQLCLSDICVCFPSRAVRLNPNAAYFKTSLEPDNIFIVLWSRETPPPLTWPRVLRPGRESPEKDLSGAHASQSCVRKREWSHYAMGRRGCWEFPWYSDDLMSVEEKIRLTTDVWLYRATRVIWHLTSCIH